MQVRAGSTYSLSEGIVVNILDFVKHPDYEETPRTADIAVTFLKSPLAISSTVNVLFLPSPNSYIPDGQTAKVVGWGFESVSRIFPLDLPTVTAFRIADSFSELIFVQVRKRIRISYSLGSFSGSASACELPMGL